MHFTLTYTNKSTLLLAVLTLAAALVGAWWYIITERSTVHSEISRLETDTREQMHEILNQLDHNESDPLTTEVVADCPSAERNEFDLLLSRLDQGLSRGDLTRLDTLYRSCGDFYAQRRFVMAAQFVQHVDHYAQLLETRARLLHRSDQSVDEALLPWRTMASLEVQQSRLFADLTRLQGAIIARLLAGSSVNEGGVQELAAQAQSLRESMSVKKTEIETARSGLSLQ